MMRLHSTLFNALLLLALGLVAAACHRQQEDADVVARAYDNVLYRSDIASLVSSDVSPEDSAAIVDNYIRHWAQQMVLLEKARRNVDDDFEAELRNYKNSLTIYAYECQIADQLLDTVVTEQQVHDYYDLHHDSFTLKNSIVKALYVKMPVSQHAAITKLKALMGKRTITDDDFRDIQLLSQHSLASSLDPDWWMPFYKLQSEVPMNTYNEDLYLKSNTNIVLNTDSAVFVVRILDFRVTDQPSPVEMEYDNIRNILLNSRKVEILDNMRNDLLKEAEVGGKVEYVNK